MKIWATRRPCNHAVSSSDLPRGAVCVHMCVSVGLNTVNSAGSHGWQCSENAHVKASLRLSGSSTTATLLLVALTENRLDACSGFAFVYCVALLFWW